MPHSKETHPAMREMSRRDFLRLAGLAAAGAATGCAINPVTGKSQLMLVSEQDEIRIDQTNRGPPVLRRLRGDPGSGTERIRGSDRPRYRCEDPPFTHALLLSQRERTLRERLRLSRRQHRLHPGNPSRNGERGPTRRPFRPRAGARECAAHGPADVQGHAGFRGPGRGFRGGGRRRPSPGRPGLGPGRDRGRGPSGQVQPGQRAAGGCPGPGIHGTGRIQSRGYDRPDGHAAKDLGPKTRSPGTHVFHPPHERRALCHHAPDRGRAVS